MKPLSALVVAACLIVPSPALSQLARADVPVGVTRDAVQPGSPAVVVSADPNSIRVVAVTVPAELHGGGRFELERLNSYQVLSRLTGSLAPGDLERPVTVTVVIPADAAAGRTTVANVRFTCATRCEEINVPVVIDVREQRGLHVVADHPMVTTGMGQRARIDATVTNTGNVVESVTMSAEAPPGWRTRVLSRQPLLVAPGHTQSVRVEVTPDGSFGEGDYEVTLIANGSETGRASVTVHVEGVARNAGGYPSLTATAAVAYGEEGTLTPAFGADLSARLANGMLLTGRGSFLHGSNSSPWAQRSLGRLGYARSHGTLTLDGPGLDASVGSVGAATSGLLGAGLWGNGVTASLTRDSWRGSAQAIQPNRGQGHYLIGNTAFRTGRLWTGISIADLSESDGTDRSARVIAADVSLPWKDGFALIQTGYRQGAEQQGATLLAQGGHRSDTWGVNALASHAPGGAQTFARAENEVQVDGYRRLGSRGSASAGAWSSQDSRAGERFASTGWSTAQQIAFKGAGTFTARVRGSDWSWERTASQFTNSEIEAGVSWDGDIAGIRTTISVARASVDRYSSLGAGLEVDATAPRTTASLAFGGTTRWGSWQSDVLLERTGAGVGIPERQATIGGRIDQIPLIRGRVFGHAEFLTHRLGSGSGGTSQAAGVEINVDGIHRIVVDAERNGVALSSGAPWVLSAQVSRVLRLPFETSSGPAGTVFGDMNGNGTRDDGEHGLAGAVVRIDGRSIRSDRNGRFRAGNANVQRIDVDPRSLPAGWMAAPHTGSKSRLELAVLPTQPLELTLMVPPQTGSDTVHVRLETAVIVLTDSLGRRWTGSPDATGKLRFGSLRPGVYELTADLTQIGIALILPASIPRVRIEAGLTPHSIELLLTTRPLRMRGTETIIRKVSGGSRP